MVRACCFLLLAMLPPLAAAQAYRWVDEKGQVHYSQVPPPGKNAQGVGPPPPPSASPNQDSLNKSLSDEQSGRDYRQQQLDQLAQRKAERETQCRGFRDQLAYMDQKTAVRMSTTDDKGNLTRVTEEQFQARRAELQKAIADGCN